MLCVCGGAQKLTIADIPYCGFLIDTKTLDMSIDHERLTAARELLTSHLLTTSNSAVVCAAQQSQPRSRVCRLAEQVRRACGGADDRQLENRNHVAFVRTMALQY